MPISPSGTTNLAALTVPNLYVQIVPPNPLLNGVPTDIVGIVGTASWGQLNAPIVVGNIQEQVLLFGTPNPILHDLGTAVYASSLQGASNFRCVRVSDGTDTKSKGSILDDATVPSDGAVLTAFYTGSAGNKIKANISNGSAIDSYKLSIYMDGGIPEVFDNLYFDINNAEAGWDNIISAINNGQSIQRGPSKLVVASLPTTGSISEIVITNSGIYSTIPTVSVADGTGATFSVHMSYGNSTIPSHGTGYEVNDEITLTGGTFVSPVKIRVDTVGTSGDVLTWTVISGGEYSVLPTNPISQGSTTGIGTGAQFSIQWGLQVINVLTHGSGYNHNSIVTISSGLGTATLLIGSNNKPALITNSLSGGTDGSSNITSLEIIGNDSSSPRTGMYALRNNISGGVFMLSDESDSSNWTLQNQFAREEGCYCIAAMAPGYQDNLAGAKAILQNAGIDSYSFSPILGDWIQINDPFNGLTRFISPQAPKCGVLASLLPSDSSLNKQISGIIATQKTLEGRSYSTADLSEIRTSRLEVITNPIPSGNVFGCRLGINSSSNPLTQTDNYPRMVNFLGQTLLKGMGIFIGKAQTPTVREQARAMILTFLHNIFNLEMIGDVNHPGDFSKACSVILDDSNNPPDRVALGYMQADVSVVLWSIVQYFVVNLNAEQGSLVSILPPQTGGL